MSRDVFISYCSADSSLAFQVCTALELANQTCWMAPRDITPGAEWAEAIHQAIAQSRVLVIVLTPGAVISPQVLREVTLAVHFRRPIITVRFDPMPLSASLEYHLSATQWLNAVNRPVSDVLDSLVENVRFHLSRPETTSVILPLPPNDLFDECPRLFVDRERELERMMQANESASHGRGQTVFVTSLAGGGKTTLLSVFGRRIQQLNPRLLIGLGRCYSTSGGSYAPFRAASENLLLRPCRSATQDQPAPVDVAGQTLRNYGVQYLGPLAYVLGMATDAVQARVANATVRAGQMFVPSAIFDKNTIPDLFVNLLANLSHSWPLAVFLDDFHWADESSLQLLRHLGRSIDRLPVLVVCAYRPECLGQNPLLAEVEHDLGSYRNSTIVLDDQVPSSTGNAAEMFCRKYLLARYNDILSERFVAILAHTTKGNPLFLGELLTNLEEKGILVHDGIWRLRESFSSFDDLPKKIEHVISERLGRLDEGLQKILRVASVQGPRFSVEVVADVLELDEREVLALLGDRLMRQHRLVREEGFHRLADGRKGHHFLFGHVLVQLYLYQRLAAYERAELHERIANRMVERWSNSLDEIADSLANHYAQARLHTQAAKYSLRAAKLFARQHGWSEVTRMARLGLENCLSSAQSSEISESHTELQLRILYARGEFEGGLYVEVIDHTQTGIDILLKFLPDLTKAPPALAAEAYLTLGRLYMAHQLTAEDGGNEYLKKALEIYQDLGDTPGILAVLSPEVLDSNPAGQWVGGSRLADCQRCLKLAEELGDPTALAKVLLDLARHYINYDSDVADPLWLADGYARRALNLSQVIGDAVHGCHVLMVQSWIAHHRGCLDESLEGVRRELLDQVRRLGQTVLEAEALTDLAHFYALRTDSQTKARLLMQQAFDFRRRMGRHAIHDSEQYAAFLFRSGRLEAGLELLRGAIRREGVFRAVRTRGDMARALLMLGREAESAQLIGEIEAAYLEFPALADDPNPGLMFCYALLSMKEKALSEARVIEGAFGPATSRGLTYTYHDYGTELAEAYLLLGSPDRARRWIDAAASCWARLAQSYQHALHVIYWEHRLCLGKVLFTEGRLEEAETCLVEAMMTLGEIGHPGQADGHNILAEVHQKNGHGAAAAEHLARSRTICKVLGLQGVADYIARRREVVA